MKKRSIREILDELVTGRTVVKDIHEAKSIVDERIKQIESLLSLTKGVKKSEKIQLESDLQSLKSLSESMSIFIELRTKKK